MTGGGSIYYNLLYSHGCLISSLKKYGPKGAFTYDVSSRGGRGFQNADGCWGGGLSLADVSKIT